MFFKGNNISTVLASAVAVFLFLRLGLLSFLCRDGSHRHRQRHHRTANPQGVALAFFSKTKKSWPRQFTCAGGVLPFGRPLETFRLSACESCWQVRRPASFSQWLLAGCSSSLRKPRCWVGSSMVEQRPFKPLVVSSSLTRPTTPYNKEK